MLTPEQLASVAVINFGDALAQTTVRKLLDHVYYQQARIAELEATNTAMLYLMADIRKACGDNGKRMQDELVTHIGELAQDAARYRWIRQFAHPVSDSIGIYWHFPLIEEDKTGNSLNDAIDADMKEQQ